MKQTRFIYFDIGGVILSYTGGIEELIKHTGKPRQTVEAIFERYSEPGERGKLTSQQLWKVFQQELDFHHPAADFAEFWTDHFEPIRPMHAFIEELLRHYRLGLISNIQAGVYEEALQKGHVPNIPWSVVIKSCEVGWIKPETAIFRLAQQQAGVKPQEILLIDDSVANVEAVRKLGWQGFVFEGKRPVSSIDRVKKLLRRR